MMDILRPVLGSPIFQFVLAALLAAVVIVILYRAEVERQNERGKRW